MQVSVLMPVYNGVPFIKDAIASVLDQTFKDFELLLLDDGSTDPSLGILRDFERTDPRVRVFSRENRGLISSLNELVSLARGRYIARMDADDISLPGRFAKQVAFLDDSPGHILVGGWVEQMDASGRPIGIIKSPTSHAEIDASHLRGRCSIWHPTVMIRREAFDTVGRYDPNFEAAEDLELWLRMAEHGKLANLPEIVLRYRLHEDSISAKAHERQRDAARAGCEAAYVRRGIQGQFEANDHWRPGEDSESKYAYALKYGWTAWSNGYRDTWWTYARQALRLRPFAPASWKLLVFGFLRSPRRKDLVPSQGGR